jgi:hypothetical protein
LGLWDTEGGILKAQGGFEQGGFKKALVRGGARQRKGDYLILGSSWGEKVRN